MKYIGVIVKESLSDVSILNQFEVLSIKTVGPKNDVWNLIKVISTKKQLTALREFIKDGPWYANFWNDKEMIVVFKNKITFDEKEAVEYGLSIGIPLKQLDFKKD